MSAMKIRYALCLMILLVAPGAPAQEREPHLGYVYPGGGRRGTTFEATLGGQYLQGAKGVLISGLGVRAEVLDHKKPPTKGQFNRLRQKLQELRKQRLEEQKKKAQEGRGNRQGRKGRKAPRRSGLARLLPEGAEEFEKIARSVGLKDFTLLDFIAYLKRRRDPKRQLNPQIEEEVFLRVTIDPEAEPGRCELRLLTRSGLTNPIFFYVGQYREYREEEPNDTGPERGIGEELPVTINGRVMPGDVDRFSFIARRGQTLVAAACARELVPYLADAVPGWFQAVLSIYDEKGVRVAYVDDFRFHPDPVLLFRVPADGTYTLEVRDSIYRGREDFVYRIDLGRIPYVTAIFPLGGRAGEKHTVRLSGWNLPRPTVEVDCRREGAGLIRVGTERGRISSNRVPFMVDTLPGTPEQEPNDDRDRAQPLAPGRVVEGRVDRPGDGDFYRFAGQAGQEITAEVFARRLASPVDSLLVLTDAAGKVVAANDDWPDKGAGLTTHHADSRLCYRLPAAGTYYLRLTDRQQQGGEAFAYRLRLAARQPDFALRVVPASINARPGTSVPITVHALRRDGFADAIELGLAGAPAGCSLSGGLVPAGADRVRLTLRLPRQARPEPFELRLTGIAMIDGARVLRPAVPAEDMMQAFIYRHLVPMERLLVSVGGRGRGGPPLRVAAERPLRLPAGMDRWVRVAGADRRLLARVKLELKLEDPPAGVKIGETRISKGGDLSFQLRTDAGKIEPGCRGNLLVQVFLVRSFQRKGSKAVRVRRIPIGYLPAIPFEAVRARL